MRGIIHSTESFGAADGPGIRYVVFMQGCNMRCVYCHNPDTWQKSGMEIEADELIRRALRYRDYWGKTGGITVSGGEPMLQPEFVTELFELAHGNGINTALDTSAQPYDGSERFSALTDLSDLVLLDIKFINDETHIRNTGHSNAPVLAYARELERIGKPVWIRHVLVPGLESDGELEKLGKFIRSLSNVKRVDILPYHTVGASKWDALGIRYALSGVKAATADDVRHAREIMGTD